MFSSWLFYFKKAYCCWCLILFITLIRQKGFSLKSLKKENLHIDSYINSVSTSLSQHWLFIHRRPPTAVTTTTWLRSWHLLKQNKNSLIKSKSRANFIRHSLNAHVVYEPVMDLASQQGSSGLRDETTQIIHYLPSLIQRRQIN